MEDSAFLTLHLTCRNTTKVGDIQYLQVEAIRSSHLTTSPSLDPIRPMPQTTSPINTYFDQKWIGLKVHIATPEETTVEWTLNQKIYERERTSDHHGKEARAIFRCTDADNKKCIIKIRML